MKKLLFLLLFFVGFSSFAQTYVEKYNSLNGAYEYFDKQTNKMVAYKSYNSLNGTWETTYVNNNNERSGSRYVPQKQRTDDNFALLQQVMELKQKRYDNLSYEDKIRMNQAYHYNQRKRNVAIIYNKYINQVDKDYSKFIKEGKKNFIRNKDKNSINIATLKDGWYECFTVINVPYNGVNNSLNLKRYIQIINNNIINYIGNNDVIYPVEKSNIYSNIAEVSIYPNNELEKYTIYVVSDRSLKKTPKFYNGGIKLFYTTLNDIGEVDIIIKGKQVGYIWIGKLKYYLDENTSVNCGFNKGVVSVTLPPGEYEYLATTDTKIWRSSFIINDEMNCNVTELIN